MGIDLEDERSRVKQLLLRLQRIAIESSSVANTGPSDDSASSNPFLAALASIRTISSLSTTERTIIGLGTAAAGVELEYSHSCTTQPYDYSSVKNMGQYTKSVQ